MPASSVRSEMTGGALHSAWRHARLYPWYLRANWLALMAYPVPFALQNLFGIVYSLGSVATVWVLFSNIRAIGQWTFPQILLIYGLSILSRSLFHLFWVDLMNVSGMVRSGEMDRLLVRPLSPLFQVVAGYLDNDDWGELLLSVYLIWTSLGMLGQRTAPNLLWMLVAGISGSVIFASVHIVANATAFFTIVNRGMTQLAWDLDEFTRYPADVYQRGLRALLTWVVPVTFASFYPAQLVLGEGRMAAIGRMTPLVAALSLCVANRFWKWALGHYQGVGN